MGALPEIVEHGQTGYLVPPRDERALAVAIVDLLQNKERRHRLGANGKRKIDNECSPNAVAGPTVAIYRRALNDTNPKHQRRRIP